MNHPSMLYKELFTNNNDNSCIFDMLGSGHEIDLNKNGK